MATNIKEKISKLLALADNPNENEAREALLKARELMAKHKLSLDDVEKTAESKVIREVLDVTCTKMTNPWAVELSAVIAENYCCRAYRNKKNGGRIYSIGFVGLEEDFEIAKRIFLYAYSSIIDYCSQHIKTVPGDPSGSRRRKCNAYGYGFTVGVLRAFERQNEKNQEWGLVLSVPKEVDDSISDMRKDDASFADPGGKENFEYHVKGYYDGIKFDPTRRLTESSAS